MPDDEVTIEDSELLAALRTVAKLSERLTYAAHDVERRDERIVALGAERDRLAIAGNNLAAHLNQLNTEQYDRRYTADGPCSGCYDAVIEWNALGAAGSTDSSTP